MEAVPEGDWFCAVCLAQVRFLLLSALCSQTGLEDVFIFEQQSHRCTLPSCAAPRDEPVTAGLG